MKSSLAARRQQRRILCHRLEPGTGLTFDEGEPRGMIEVRLAVEQHFDMSS